jgi:hypothetical protein
MFYSATTNSYYLPESPSLPDDCVKLTESHYRELLEGCRIGKILHADEKGYPILRERVWTQEEQAGIAESQRLTLLAMAEDQMKALRTDLLLGTITDDDKATLIIWQSYIKALKAVDTATAPDIVWPECPA